MRGIIGVVKGQALQVVEQMLRKISDCELVNRAKERRHIALP
jgi:hypothetical protein